MLLFWTFFFIKESLKKKYHRLQKNIKQLNSFNTEYKSAY